MADDELIEDEDDLEAELEDLDEVPVDLDDDLVDVLEVDDDLPVDELDLEADVVVEDEDDLPAPVKAKRDDDEGDDDDEEEDDPDDVEADLDAILKDRIAAAEEEVDEEELAAEPEDRADGTGRVAPKRPGEFVCQSCFLVKHPTQLADAKRQLCGDCV